MNIPEMLSQSGILTLLGMGVVFSFLILLIVVMKLVELLVRAAGLDKDVQNEGSASVSAGSASGTDQSVVAAIAAALNDKLNK